MNEQSNPFSIVFGKEPQQIITRDQIIEEIVNDFTMDKPSKQIILLTGVRGSGKSALTASLMREFASKKGWFVVDLLVENDMLLALADKLYNLHAMKAAFKESKVSFSLPGLSAELSGSKKQFSVEAELEKMLKALKKQKKRLLITVDDVASVSTMKTFAHFFQSCLMKDYDVFLIMNGVYDNIANLQNQKTLTFLQRSPKIELKPFSKSSVYNLYSNVFEYPEQSLRQMADLTEGYPYAVQVLGYLTWKDGNKEKFNKRKIVPLYDGLLADGVYSKLWDDMSEKDREIVNNLIDFPDDAVKTMDFVQKMGENKQLIVNYKKRLIQKGILIDKRGIFQFALPRFKEYVQALKDYE